MIPQRRRLIWRLWLAMVEVVVAFAFIVAYGRRAVVPPPWVVVVITAGLLAHATVTVYGWRDASEGSRTSSDQLAGIAKRKALVMLDLGRSAGRRNDISLRLSHRGHADG